MKDLPRRPQRRVTTRGQDRYIATSHLRDRRLTARQTARGTVGRHGRRISDQTVRNRLRESGLRARRPYVGLVLTRRHRRLRLDWARRHLRFTRADWGNVLFSDESRFNLRRSDGRTRVFRRRGERYADACVTEKGQFGGGSVMVWAGISLHTKTRIIPIHQNLNAQMYQNLILQPEVIPHVRGNRGMVFMQDNATPHTARTTRHMPQTQNIRVLDWPPCSPDLNPIEHVWDELDRRIRQPPQPQTLQNLERSIINVWNNLPKKVSSKLR